MRNVFFSDLMAFIMLNKGDTFAEFNSEIEIAVAIKKAIDNQTLYWHQGTNGMIDGMIMAERRGDVLFVTENLSMNLKNLKEFARRAKKDFEGLKLEWLKNGQHKKHDTDKVYKKLSL